MSNEATPRGGEETGGVRRQVLSVLRDEGRLTRIELSRRTGLSPTTITRVVSQLLQEGCVAEAETVTRGRTGRPGTQVAVVPSACGVLGVHLGVGAVRFGLVDAGGNDHGREGFDYDPRCDAETVLTRVAVALSEMRARRTPGSPDRTLGVGVAVPGPVDDFGRRLLMPMNLGWRDVPVADLLEERLGLPVVVEHNVRAMALAEARVGLGRGLGSVAFVYLRTGLGAGLVVAGRGFQGGVRGAVELGHLRVVDHGAPCVCGGHGCLETVVSDRALRHILSGLQVDPEDAEPLVALVAAAESSSSAASALDEVITHLATGLAALMNLLTPELILLGGAFAHVPDSLVDRLADETRAAVFPVIRAAVRIQRSGLPQDPGVDGAATVALDRFFYC
ncbi:ROK family transcriptional regulator [Aquipuribacter sp. MA13-6]|uniref:ROK family transcriptional regulator n=1 Tax=unclassified Aquipuribacter TaxID=2635084 RepID=UPI003EEE3CBA